MRSDVVMKSVRPSSVLDSAFGLSAIRALAAPFLARRNNTIVSHDAIRPELERYGRPSIIILGVGHSGTSVLTKMLFELGWKPNQADSQYCEETRFRELNIKLLEELRPPEELQTFIRQLEQPFALKDPRFVLTWRLWLSAFASEGIEPLLLYIVREATALEESYKVRRILVDGQPGSFNHPVTELRHKADEAFQQWPYGKLCFSYESIRRAVAAFSVARKRRNRTGGLWK